MSYTLRCLTAYNADLQDKGAWFPGWGVLRNVTDDDDSSYSNLEMAYMFQTEEVLNGNSYWGKLNWYMGGGFIASLGNTLQVGG